jgi:hypothetical protein
METTKRSITWCGEFRDAPGFWKMDIHTSTVQQGQVGTPMPEETSSATPKTEVWARRHRTWAENGENQILMSPFTSALFQPRTLN